MMDLPSHVSVGAVRITPGEGNSSHPMQNIRPSPSLHPGWRVRWSRETSYPCATSRSRIPL